MAGLGVKLGEYRLESLLESAKLLNSTLKRDDLLRHLMRTVMGRFLVGRCAIAIKGNDGMRIAMARGSAGLTPGDLFDQETARLAGLDLFFSMGDPEEPIGVLAMSRPPRGDLRVEEEDFLRALLGLAASSVANAQAHDDAVRSNRSLDQKIQELRALLDLVRGLASTLEPEEIAQMLMLTLSGRWIVRKWAIVTWKPGQPALVRERGMELIATAELKEIAVSVSDAQLAETGPILDQLAVPAGSLLLPLRNGQETFGLVVCGPRMGTQGYGEADLEFGAGLVAQAAVAFENAWHFRETLGKKQLENELSLAAAIQQGLFPSKLPTLAQTDIAARNRQAKQVGGDYYDAIPIDRAAPDAPHLLCVVDISGKGMFASILMSNIQATLRALLSEQSTLPLVAKRTNDLMYASTPSNRYATAILVVYDPVSGECHWVNCGHNDGIILRKGGEVEMLPCSGLALGLFPKRTYEEQEFRLEDGDLLCLYSDGVTEAQDLSEIEFSIERLTECLRANRDLSSTTIVDAVFRDIDAFVGSAPQFDDITLMVVKRGSQKEL
jgi:sigma-B regulation protein RsbU (phosphoserine phosphatase)